MISKHFFENLVFYEIRWKNVLQPDTLQTIRWRIRILWWVTKATNTHSEYEIILIFHSYIGYMKIPQYYADKYIDSLVTVCVYINLFFKSI